MRTFPLISMAGFLASFLATDLDSPLLLATGVAGAFAVALMITHVRHTLGQTGITTPMAMILTFLLGAAIARGYVFESVAIGVVATFLLVAKQKLHAFANYLDEAELLSALQFIALVFVLLPLMARVPRDALGIEWLGRGELVDPYVILLVVVFVSSISFVSLLAMRQVGPRRGLEFSGLLGGLVNSEATTASLGQRAAADSALLQPALVAAVLASTTMLVRNLAIVAFADPTFRLVGALLPYVVPVALVGVWYAWRLHLVREGPIPPVRVGNPFAVGPALRFALLFAGVSVVAELARATLGETGIYITALGGFVSAGAVLASLASLVATGAIPLGLALQTSLLAIAASLGGKLLILRAVNVEMMRRGATPFLVMTLLAVIAAAAALVLAG